MFSSTIYIKPESKNNKNEKKDHISSYLKTHFYKIPYSYEDTDSNNPIFLTVNKENKYCMKIGNVTF